jgi:hypothetical protein
MAWFVSGLRRNKNDEWRPEHTNALLLRLRGRKAEGSEGVVDTVHTHTRLRIPRTKKQRKKHHEQETEGTGRRNMIHDGRMFVDRGSWIARMAQSVSGWHRAGRRQQNSRPHIYSYSVHKWPSGRASSRSSVLASCPDGGAKRLRLTRSVFRYDLFHGKSGKRKRKMKMN